MPVFGVEIRPVATGGRTVCDTALCAQLREAGLEQLATAHVVRLFFLEGQLGRADAERVAAELLCDPVVEAWQVNDPTHVHQAAPDTCEVEVHGRPGVMDPVAQSTLAELHAQRVAVDTVRTARRYVVTGCGSATALLESVRRALANDCIEEVVPGTAGVRPAPQPPIFRFSLRHVPIRDLDDAGLDELSRTGHLFLSTAEMRTLQAHYRALGREPTDLELETLAQTWSEHCVHKTLKSRIDYCGAPFGDGARGETCERKYGNLLRDTIARATDELIAAGRGPRCLSVFKDNAGIIAFDDEFGIAFKVETHNHPSAIEPYGGAATGVGGCIRDVIGCGLGAKPIANTDVFCVAPGDWRREHLPKGVLHPRRILRGIALGVSDYGNRMGIPTVNGAVVFEPRYLGNPLVYCGCVGLIPRDKVEKAAQPGDLVVLIGGQTGRDGIHGATFSSAELTDTHADEFSHAVQIGNAITEKRFLDAVLRARDERGGCLYSAITDCGAGGLSSAVGEMAQHVGATVDLEKVPLKYAGLRYDEIWISEAQERMVLAVPPANLERFLQIMRADEVEATVIGVFGTGVDGSPGVSGRPRLVVRFEGHVVGDLDMDFLHDGLPQRAHTVEWWPTQSAAAAPATDRTGADLLADLRAHLSRPDVAAKEWIIRQYDHEVQGGSGVKPLVGPGQGPADAAVLRPVLASQRGIALGCGLAPHLGDVDPYWMAAAAIDEAVRNVVAVGGDPRQTAVLDNFCWGRADDPRQLGALVRACQACYDVALAFGVPFISGKDSLNNEFALDVSDVEPLLAELRRYAAGDGVDAQRLRLNLPSIEARLRATRRLSIPGTLLISAVSIVPDVRRCVTPDLKQPGRPLLRVGGWAQIGFSLAEAARVHAAVADAIQQGLVAACHDVGDGGWLVALAEMAIAAGRGASVALPDERDLPPFGETCGAYVVEPRDPAGLERLLRERGVATVMVGHVAEDAWFSVGAQRVAVADLRTAWAT